MEKYLVIGLGGFLGANARYLVSGWMADRFGVAFPYGTLLVNVTGSLVLGLFLAVMTTRAVIDPRWRLLFSIGFLGAYTTFSAYTFESVQMLLDGNLRLGLVNILASNLLSLLASVLGVAIGRNL